LLQHFLTFLPHKEADPKSALGDLAKEATDKFLADFLALLAKQYGQEGAGEVINELEEAASGLSTSGTFSSVQDIELSLQVDVGPSAIGSQGSDRLSSVALEDMRSQCAMGNKAACP
jgi:hypothetical protein